MFALDDDITWTAAKAASAAESRWSPWAPRFADPTVEREYSRFATCGNVRLQASLAFLGVATGLTAAIAFAVTSARVPKTVLGTTASGCATLWVAGIAELCLCVLPECSHVGEQHTRGRRHFVLQFSWVVASVLISVGSALDGLSCTKAAGQFSSKDACNESANVEFIIAAACVAVSITSARTCALILGLVFIASCATALVETDKYAPAPVTSALRVLLLAASVTMLGVFNLRREQASREHFCRIIEVRCARQTLAAHHEQLIAIVRCAMPEGVARRIGASSVVPRTAVISASTHEMLSRTDTGTNAMRECLDYVTSGVVAAVGLAESDRFQSNMQSYVASVHQLYSILDAGVAVFGVERAGATGDVFMVTSGLLRDTEVRPERCLRFATWATSLGGRPFALRAVVAQGPMVGSVVARRRYVVGGPAIVDTLKAIVGVPTQECYVDRSVRTALQKGFSNEFHFAAVDNAAWRHWYSARPVTRGGQPFGDEESGSVPPPAEQHEGGGEHEDFSEMMARASYAMVVRDKTTASGSKPGAAADAEAKSDPGRLNIIPGVFVDPELEGKFFEWAVARCNVGYPSLALISASFLLIVALVSTVDFGTQTSNNRSPGAAGALAVFFAASAINFTAGISIRFGFVSPPQNPRVALAAMFAVHTLFFMTTIAALFFAGTTIVTVDPHFLFLCLIPEAMITLCAPLSAVAATGYTAALVLPVFASGILQFGYSLPDLVLNAYVLSVTVAIGAYGPFTVRRLFFAEVCAIAANERVHESARALVELVSRLVPAHVVDLGMQLIAAGDEQTPHVFGGDQRNVSAMTTLKRVKASHVRLEASDPYSELVVIAMRCDAPASVCDHVDRFARSWSFLATAIDRLVEACGLQLIEALGDAITMAGPFEESGMTLGGHLTVVIDTVRQLAVVASQQRVGFHAACTLDEGIGAYIGKHALRYLLFGPAANHAGLLLRAFPYRVMPGQAQIYATRAFVRALEPDDGFDVLHRLLQIPSGQLALFPPGSIRSFLPSNFGLSQRWAARGLGLREVSPLLVARPGSNFFGQHDPNTGLFPVVAPIPAPAHELDAASRSDGYGTLPYGAPSQ